MIYFLIFAACILAVIAYMKLSLKLEKVISTFVINLWRH